MSTTQPTLDDIWKLCQETDRQFKESDRKFQETREELRNLSKETDRKIKPVSESIGRLGNKRGDFVEEMVRPAAVRLFRECGIDLHEVHQNISSQRDGEGIEMDLLVVNDTDIIAIECNSTLGIDDVNSHLQRLQKLKRLLPSYAHKRVMGAVTGMVLPDHVARYACQQGLFVIAQTGDPLSLRKPGEPEPTPKRRKPCLTHP